MMMVFRNCPDVEFDIKISWVFISLSLSNLGINLGIMVRKMGAKLLKDVNMKIKERDEQKIIEERNNNIIEIVENKAIEQLNLEYEMQIA